MHKHQYVNHNLSLFTAVYYSKLMSKTVSARIPNKRHDELRERCNKLGCTMNEFIENSLYLAMDNTVDFDFDLEEQEDEEPEPQITITEIPEKQVSKLTNVRVVEI